MSRLPRTISCMLGVLALCACTSNTEPDPGNSQEQRTPPPHAAPPAEMPGGASSRNDAADQAVVSTTARMVEEQSARAPGSAALFMSPGTSLPAADRESYPHADDNPVKLARRDPVSTFSIDVDTAAYGNVRRLLNRGALPPADAVRVEELVNYFAYEYARPAPGEAFSVMTEVGPAPWNPGRRLLHIGIQGQKPLALPPANLVFLIDVSGSMQSADKLGLLKTSLNLLTRQLGARDRISIAVYAGSAGTVLDPTPGNQTATIAAAIDRLSAGGSTNGGAGIQLAYALARQAFIDHGINRVILATDGDFNVGTTDLRTLEDLVARERESGIALSVLGFGGGNYNDALMQSLAQNGNGNAAYIDTLNEARKVLVDELAATLDIIARDVKIQVEFNPAVVAEYRLLGYETRMLNREDFNNDRVDAGDIGAGHTVTALYEITLVGGGAQHVDALRYRHAEPAPAEHLDELALVRLRHKPPHGGASRLIERPVPVADSGRSLEESSDDFRFAAAVAGFGALLRGGTVVDGFSYADVLQLARSARGTDDSGYRGEFLSLVRTAEALQPGPVGTPLVGQH